MVDEPSPPGAGARRRLHALVPRGRLVRGAAVLVGGTALGQVVLVLVSPLLTRLYTPEDFGVLAVFAAIIGILVAVASLRYELAILLPGDDETAANLLALAVAVVGLMSLLAALALWAFGGALAAWVGTPTIESFLWLVPVGLLAMGLYKVLDYWAVRKQAFRRIARTRLTQGVGQALTQVGLGFLPLGPAGLLIGHVTGQALGGTTLAAAVHREDRRALRSITLSGMLRAAVCYRWFPAFSTGSALVTNGVQLLPALLLTAIYGPQVGGWFMLGQRVILAPIRLLGSAVAQVYLSEAPKLVHGDVGALYGLFRTTALRLLLIGLVVMAPVVLPGPQLFALVFGPEWGEAGRYVQLLGPMYLCQFVVSPISQTLTVLGREDLHFAWDASRFTVLAVVFSVAYVQHWSPAMTIGVFSVVMAAAYLIHFVMTRRLVLACAGGGTDGPRRRDTSHTN